MQGEWFNKDSSSNKLKRENSSLQAMYLPCQCLVVKELHPSFHWLWSQVSAGFAVNTLQIPSPQILQSRNLQIQFFFELQEVASSSVLHVSFPCVSVDDRLWSFLFPSGQSRSDRLQSSALPGRWSSSSWRSMCAGEKRLHFSCRMFQVFPGQPWGTQSNIKHECLCHVFRNESQTPTVSDCPLCMSLLFLSW